MASPNIHRVVLIHQETLKGDMDQEDSYKLHHNDVPLLGILTTNCNNETESQKLFECKHDEAAAQTGSRALAFLADPL